MTKIKDLENIVKDLSLKFKEKNENQENEHDSKIDEIQNTITNKNSLKEKVIDCSECDLKFISKSLLKQVQVLQEAEYKLFMIKTD